MGGVDLLNNREKHSAHCNCDRVIPLHSLSFSLCIQSRRLCALGYFLLRQCGDGYGSDPTAIHVNMHRENDNLFIWILFDKRNRSPRTAVKIIISVSFISRYSFSS